MVEEIGPKIYKIVGNGNVYLYLEPEPFLIDSSDHIDSEYIKSEISKIISPNKIKYILLTHLHYDHCGNVDLFPNAKVYASRKEIKNFRNSFDDFFIFDISKIAFEKLEHSIAFSNEIFGLKVVKTPGHTGGSVAFFDSINKILFSGDTLFHKGIGRTDFINSVPENMEESVKKLKVILSDEDIQLMPGHDY